MCFISHVKLFLLFLNCTRKTSAIVSEGMDDNRTPALVGVMVSGATTSLVVVSLRFWVRTMIVRKVGADDWVILAALVSKL